MGMGGEEEATPSFNAMSLSDGALHSLFLQRCFYSPNCLWWRFLMNPSLDFNPAPSRSLRNC